MDKIIQNAENIDLSLEDIKIITNNGCEVVVYHNLDQYNSIEQLLGEKGAVILLFETKKNFGHWTAIFYQDENRNSIEFFDSYGFAPDAELNYAKYDNTPYLTQLLEKSKLPMIYNTKKLQVFAHEINTCGRWTSLRVVFRNIPLHDFQRLFQRNKYYNGDFFVSALTYLFTMDKS
tara:strand:+ start:767 stop:1294 length:528 start_codon:yes stop_codon:yes gene_type:complete